MAAHPHPDDVEGIIEGDEEHEKGRHPELTRLAWPPLLRGAHARQEGGARSESEL